MSLINVQGLTFCYEGSYDNIFENVSFQLDTDWKLGFTGRNGRGKTTFLNLLLGKYAYGGNISASVEFEYFPFAVADVSANTVDVVSSVNRDYMEWELLRELSLLEVEEEVLSRPFATLSNGEQTKVLLAALFLKDNSFLLIDEPTNHLDAAGRRIVANYLRGKKGFILVSHDRVFLDTCVDHTLSINRANIEVQSGNFSQWYHNKMLRDNFELSQNEKLKKEIKRLEASARRTAEWAVAAEKSKIGFNPIKTEKSAGRRSYQGEKSRKMMKQSKVIESRQQSAIEEKSALLKNLEEAESLKLSPLEYRSATILSLDKVSLYYGDKHVCGDLTFELCRGDRLALRGKNGSGKSSLIKLLRGEEITHTGALCMGKDITISYVPQDTSHLSGGLDDYAHALGISIPLFKAILRKLDFSRLQFEKEMQNYSGGQKKKVLIAASLCQSAHLYIWDEPLNYIDILSRMQIEQLLLQFKPTIIFVEHDRAFCDNVATKAVDL